MNISSNTERLQVCNLRYGIKYEINLFYAQLVWSQVA